MDSKEKTIELIEQALETVRPYLHADGGDVKFVELTDDLIVKLELQGSCQSCPMSAMTFRAGLEESIRKAVPYINKVVSSNVPELA
ncbi:NifU family protein [Dyadobacter fermentans]|uniref:Nitrogen-fixing NifU domain protein n=1 Tax=Dyadobacter fermentans (strain ATCC 700827 / DSM 18053 / CIP 107007 / KCTC 52180 / NS114) TaxID=471854 RepID=C6W6S5_DYAFD|nr:NifU family protein [Dyadobacter fermentans]ACT96136.1 nitrogen-fixing NifU domain protein [Dyadobacter fermentans DSM 18053]